MLPTPPIPRRFRSLAERLRRPAMFCAVVATVSLVPDAARALELSLDPPGERGGYVWIAARVEGLFEPRVEESLARGMPATLQLRVELWKRRTAWFDRQEYSFDASIKIRYDVWSRTYRLERRGAGDERLGTLDSVRVALSRPLRLPAGRVGQLDPGARYYVLVTATLKPLDVDDVAEGEGWLSGEVEEKRSSGLGIVTAIPRALFDAMRNFAGLGDQRARAISGDFGLETLFPGDG